MSDLIERPTDAADPTYPDAERCAQTLENCEDDLLTEAAFVRWQGREIGRLREWQREMVEKAASGGRLDGYRELADKLAAKDGEIERMTEENRRLRADLLAGRNVVNAGLTIHTLTAERDELRRQLAEAEQDARRYRHLVEKHSTEVDDYGTLGITFRCDFEHYNDIDAAIDAQIEQERSEQAKEPK